MVVLADKLQFLIKVLLVFSSEGQLSYRPNKVYAEDKLKDPQLFLAKTRSMFSFLCESPYVRGNRPELF
jgi:hypothetical protein